MSGPGGTRSTPRVTPAGQAPDLGRPPGPAAGPGNRRSVHAARPSRPRLTGRGALVVMLVVFLAGNLIMAGMQADWLGGLAYAAGCLLAVTYARREALLLVATTPPLIFLVALVGAELITAQDGTVLATAEGTLLTLAAIAPWLFACTAGYLIVAVVRGLPRCVRDLRAELNGAAHTARAAAAALEDRTPRAGPWAPG